MDNDNQIGRENPVLEEQIKNQWSKKSLFKLEKETRTVKTRIVKINGFYYPEIYNEETDSWELAAHGAFLHLEKAQEILEKEVNSYKKLVVFEKEYEV